MGGVFANGLEISGKAVSAKTIAIFPDTCFTPPENPATPPGVPVPYPSFGMAGDTEKGTGTVFIKGETVNIKNKSDESKTSGTEAGCAAKKGIVSSKNTGKKYFNAWSNDVKFDAEPVVRFSDLATHNHASPSGNGPPGPEIVGSNPPPRDKCQLTTYNPNDCPAGETPHHLVGDAQFHPAGSNEFLPGVGEAFKSATGRNAAESNSTTARAFHAEGLCICLQGMVKSSMKPDEELGEMFDMDGDSNIPAPGGMGDRRINQGIVNATRQNTGRTASMFPSWSGSSPYSNTLGEHGLFHEQYDNIIESTGAGNDPPHTVTLEESAKTAALLAMRMHGCDAEEIEAQIIQHYQDRGVPPNTRLRSGIKTSGRSQPAPGTAMGIL